MSRIMKVVAGAKAKIVDNSILRVRTSNIVSSPPTYTLPSGSPKILISGDVNPPVNEVVGGPTITLNGTVTKNTTNFVNGTGSVQYGSDPSYVSFQPDADWWSGNFVIDLYVYCTSFSTTPVIVDTRSANTPGYYAIQTDGTVAIAVDSKEPGSLLYSNQKIQLNTWTSLQLYSHTTQGTKLYINGTLEGSRASNCLWDWNNLVRIGHPYHSGNQFDGYMDKISIYTVA